MKMHGSRPGFLIAMVILGAAQARPAAAGLLGNLNLEQQIDADYSYLMFSSNDAVPVTSTAIPFQQTVSGNDSYGAAVTGTYNLADNGSVATISISCSGSVNGYYNSVGEQSVGRNGTTFTLLEPVSYVATILTIGPPGSTAQLQIYGAGGTGNIYVNMGTEDPLAPNETTTGFAEPGPVTFEDGWSIGPNFPGGAADETGTYSLTVTFTAIPEPTGLSLLALGGLAFLARRRRVRRSLPAHQMM